jgi:hypothetical protein
VLSGRLPSERYNRQTTRKNKQTHTQETTKINEEKQNRKNTHGNVQSMTTCKKNKNKKQKQKTSEADSFRHMK